MTAIESLDLATARYEQASANAAAAKIAFKEPEQAFGFFLANQPKGTTIAAALALYLDGHPEDYEMYRSAEAVKVESDAELDAAERAHKAAIVLLQYETACIEASTVATRAEVARSEHVRINPVNGRPTRLPVNIDDDQIPF